MGASSPGRRLRGGLSVLGICLVAFSGPGHRLKANQGDGVLEKLIVASGHVDLELDVQRLSPPGSEDSRTGPAVVGFDLERESFLTILAFDGEFRDTLPGSARILPQDSSALPPGLASRDLVVEQNAWGAPYDLVVRDATSGLLVFNVEGHQYAYKSRDHALSVRGGRLLVSKEFAAELRRPRAAGSVVGTISIDATMRAIEVTQIVDGQVREEAMPGLVGGVPGPDVIVGDVNGLAQFDASSGTRVGLALGTDACNAGVENLNWLALPNNDHPVIPQNLYRMSGGPNNDLRFEQIGQSNVKHAFTALTQNICGFGCNGIGGTRLGSGCSDPYSAGLNAGPNLGSRAWINPFTGFFPRGDSPTPPNTHGAAHTHNGTSHRILTEIADLNTSLNAGATYWAEGQYVTPHEYAWCQTHPGECNMGNNVSYRQYTVIGTASPFSFSPAASTVRTQPAIKAWTGATLKEVRPTADGDGVGMVAYKVTNPSPFVWHYEYAIYNQNLDRGIQSFTLPRRAGVTFSNVGFHAPPQHPGWAADGTVGNAGYSNAPWAQTENGGQVTWSSETFAQNPNANAVRWGTLYNIRFDANRPPMTTLATVGFFKTGAPITISVQAPQGTDSKCPRFGPC